MPLAKPHILLVNPWIHDFAAYDVWAKPLGLLGLGGMLRQYGFKVSYYDCLNRFHPRSDARYRENRFGCGPYLKTELPKPPGLEDVPRRYCRYGVPDSWFLEDIDDLAAPDLILVTSIMTYWYPGLQHAIRLLRRRWPGTRILLGGVYATLCHDHAAANSGADRVIPGFVGSRILDLVSLETGFSIPSHVPFENFDDYPYPALDLQPHMAYAPLLTSVGCPYSCEYCAASVLTPGRFLRSPAAIESEVLHWHRTRGVRDFALYDDAFLVSPERHALPLLERLAGLPAGIRFHTPNALHIREISPRIALLLRQAGFRTIRLGLETATGHRLDFKTNLDEFRQAAAALRSAGFTAPELGAYLLVGLPGQSLDEIEMSARAAREAGIRPIPAYYTPIPHTPLWDEAVRASRYDLEADPLYSNNAIFPCRPEGFSWDFVRRIKVLTDG
ncbi:MAG: B12-binding domain-containing radical SAM protein [Desulfobacterales bacterium]